VTPGLLLSASFAAAAVLLLGVQRYGPVRLDELLGRARPAGSASSAGASAPSRSRVLPRMAAGAARWPALVAMSSMLLAASWTAGPVMAVLLAVGAASGRRWWRARRRAATVEVERRGILEACSVLAGELRAGRTSAEALRAGAVVATGPSQAVLRTGAATAGLGGDVAGVLGAVPLNCAVPDVLRSLAACWSVCSATGGGLAAAVDRLEEGLRADQVLRQALAAELAGPRATAGLLAVLPVVGLLLAGALGADPLAVLLHTPLGLVCLVGGVGLDAVGVLWTNRLVRRAGG
jgi:tight adherence protein B